MDASNIYQRRQITDDPEKHTGIDKVTNEPNQEFVDFVYESFLAMEKGLNHELLGLIRFCNQNYTFLSESFLVQKTFK